MSSGQATQLVTAVAQLVGVLIWPAVLVFFLIRFRHSLADFLGNLGEFSFKAPGLEASAKRQQVEAAAALGAAIATRAPAEGAPATTTDPRDVVEALPTPRSQRRLQGKRILWVDDRPENNHFERQTLEALGVRIDLSTSTEEALQKTRQRSYDLIISDMGRPQMRGRDTPCLTSFEERETRRRLSFMQVHGRLNLWRRPADTEQLGPRTCHKS